MESTAVLLDQVPVSVPVPVSVSDRGSEGTGPDASSGRASLA